MTSYKPRRHKESEECKCGHVNGAHGGHFGLRMILVMIGCVVWLPVSYFFRDPISCIIVWQAIMIPCIFFGLFPLKHYSCEYCTCSNFSKSEAVA